MALQEFGRQHTKERFSLSKDKQRKLVFVKQHVRMQQRASVAPWQRPFLDWVHAKWLAHEEREAQKKIDEARRKLAEAEEDAEQARAEGDLEARVAAAKEVQGLIAEIDALFTHEAVCDE